MEDIRTQIRSEIKAQKTTIKAVSKRAGYHNDTVAMFLRGRSNMGVDSVADICEVLGYHLALVPMEVE